MNVLITGSGGQAGTELLYTAPKNFRVTAAGHEQLDITERAQVEEAIHRFRPDLIINAAAYTNVDGAEEHTREAFAANAEGVNNLALCSAKSGARFIHISTDYVFDGRQAAPYKPSDPVNPINVYGQSKLEGERLLFSGARDRSLIIRTGWVFSRTGKNFVKTMLNLMRSRSELSVVSDQVGTPTWARTLAEVIWKFAPGNHAGQIHHWSDGGVASWYDFSVAIMEEALALGLLERPVAIVPVDTSAYPTRARRPQYSVLDKGSTLRSLAMAPRHWRCVLRTMLAELVE